MSLLGRCLYRPWHGLWLLVSFVHPINPRWNCQVSRVARFHRFGGRPATPEYPSLAVN